MIALLKSNNLIFWLLIAFSASITFRIIGMTYQKTIVLFFVFIIAAFINTYDDIKSGKNRDYLKRIAAYLRSEKKSNQKSAQLNKKPSSSGRVFKYDIIRIIATFMVILLHVIESGLSEGIDNNIAYIIFSNIRLLLYPCNILYVMVSAALLIPWKNESIAAFYKKRICRIVVPMLIYYIFSSWQYRKLLNFNVESFLTMLKELYTGDMVNEPQYWILYVLISVSIVIPLLRYAFKDMSYGNISFFALLSIIMMALDSLVSVKPGIFCFLSSWVGVAVIGYWLSRKETRVYDSALVVFSVACAILVLYFYDGSVDYVKKITYCTPQMCFMAGGIFSAVCIISKKIQNGNGFTSVFCKYSYSILLVHWWVLYWITVRRFDIHVSTAHYAGLFASFIITLIVSFIMAYYIDNLIIMYFYKLMSVFSLKPKNNKHKKQRKHNKHKRINQE